MRFTTALLFGLLAAHAVCAGTVPCASGVADVTTLAAGNGCTLGAFTFENFSVTPSGAFTGATIGIIGAELANNEANLQFLLTSNPTVITGNPGGSAWINLMYETFTPQPWIDSVDLTNIDGVGVVIYETVCASSFAANYGQCPTGDLLGTLHATPGQHAAINLARPVDHLFTEKWIAYGDASLTRFDNSASAPEPATYLGMAGGLMLLGLVKRRRKA